MLRHNQSDMRLPVCSTVYHAPRYSQKGGEKKQKIHAQISAAKGETAALSHTASPACERLCNVMGRKQPVRKKPHSSYKYKLQEGTNCSKRSATLSTKLISAARVPDESQALAQTSAHISP